MGGLERLARYFIAPELAVDPESYRRALVVLVFSALIVVFAPGFLAVAFYAYDAPIVGVISLGAASVGALTPSILRVTRSVPIAASVLTLAITLNIALVVASSEGLTSPALPWLALIPVFAIATAGRRAGIIWSLICLVLVFLLMAMTRFDWLPSHEMPLAQRQSAAAWNTILLVVFIAGFILMHEGLRERSLQAVRKMHDELDQARRRQMVADRLASLGTLAAGVGHEINNPLTYVLGNLKEVRAEIEALGPMSVPPRQISDWASAIDEAIEGSTRVAQIVGDLRAFARSDDEPFRVADPSDALRSALRITAAYWRERVRVVEQLDHLPLVRCAPSKLIQVFVNLITNAVEAMPDRPSQENQIRLIARRTSDVVEILVEDNGSGIAPEVMARMFEPFFTTKPVGSGTGLGLATSRAYVQAAGGRLEVSSTPGAGTTFTVVLPVSQDASPEPSPPPAAPEERILVVDSDVLVTKVVRRLLRRRAAIVVESSGERALVLLEQERFDWILCDVMLPGIDGIEFYSRLKTLRPELADRVAFMSSGAIPFDAARFLESMQDRCLEKPFDPAALQALADRMRR